MPLPRALSAVVLAAIAILLAAGGYGIAYIIQNPDPCDRTQEMRDALELAADRKCDLITGDDLADIDHLVIHFEDEMPKLKRRDFAGLRHLEGLAYDRTVDRDDPPAIPSNVFSGLPKHLQSLGFGIGLTELPPGVFDGLANLQSLNLGLGYSWDSNYLTELPPGAFDGLANLQSLYLQSNDLTELATGVFVGLTNLQSLYLHGNDLTELPPGVFGGLANLQSLSLNGNNLTELPPGVFDGLASLQSLYLDENVLRELPPGVFDGLANLQSLYLNGNDLTEWVPDVFDGHTNLQSLYLCSLSSWSYEMQDWRRGGRVITNLQSMPLSIIPGRTYRNWDDRLLAAPCRMAWPRHWYE